ncbi:MAG: hypothetical protein WCL39_08435 [Armatimonadota bacterium]
MSTEHQTNSGQHPQDDELSDIADAVAHNVCQGRSLEVTLEVLRKAGFRIGSPSVRDYAASVLQSLTTPLSASGQTALALIGDYPHDPNYIRPALEAVLQRTGLETRFIYDVRLFGAKSLEGCELLVVLRDGSCGQSLMESLCGG